MLNTSKCFPLWAHTMEQLSLFQYFSWVALTDSLCLMEYGFKYKIKEPVNQIFPKRMKDFRIIPVVRSGSASPTTHCTAQATDPPAPMAIDSLADICKVHLLRASMRINTFFKHLHTEMKQCRDWTSPIPLSWPSLPSCAALFPLPAPFSCSLHMDSRNLQCSKYSTPRLLNASTRTRALMAPAALSRLKQTLTVNCSIGFCLVMQHLPLFQEMIP